MNLWIDLPPIYKNFFRVCTTTGKAFHHPVIESLSEAGNDILSWGNYSFDNEQANGVRYTSSRLDHRVSN